MYAVEGKSLEVFGLSSEIFLIEFWSKLFCCGSDDQRKANTKEFNKMKKLDFARHQKAIMLEKEKYLH